MPADFASSAVDESSPRYDGWRITAVCFVVAMFCWGFGLYGHRLGPRRVFLVGTCCLGSAVALLALIAAPWQLYLVYLIMALGSAAMHVGAITNVLGLW